MAHDVFISYSSKDKPIADAVCANIEAAGIRCWIAPRDIAPGEDWPTAIARAITKSRVMVLVFSANSNSSEDVGRELMLAANNKLVIIPFKTENIEPEPGKQYYLARMHWLDALNPPTREQIQSLVKTVKSFIPVIAEQEHPQSANHPNAGQTVPGNKPVRVRLWIPVGLLLFCFISAVFIGVIWSRKLAGTQPILASEESATTMATSSTPVTLTPTLMADVPPMTPIPLDWNINVSHDFSSNDNWPTWMNSNDGCSISSLDLQDGALLWAVDAIDRNQCGYLVYPGVSSVSDFDISLDVRRSSGAGEADFGIAFRILDADNHYVFAINDMTQNFGVFLVRPNSRSRLINWKYDSAINSDGYNHLAISARGPAFIFYVNDTLVGAMEDSGIASGYIGAMVETYNGGDVSVSYDNFVLHGIK